MRTFTLLCAFLFVVESTIAGNLLSIDLVKDRQQYDACKASPDPNTFAGIRYGDGPAETVQYNECVPWRRPDREGVIANAVFCRPGTCFVFSDTKCKEQSVPVPVIVPVSVDFLNAVDFVEVLGQSAFCAPSGIPQLPL